MSDTGRQSFTDKAESTVKPDSQKSTTEQAGDKMKGASDSISSTVQPEVRLHPSPSFLDLTRPFPHLFQSQKSTGQQMGDTVSGNQNENTESTFDKAKETVGLGGGNRST
ncbi:hypothetical protein EW146_g7675 [Bondarzewia mesenterica]|uniref:Uncharacterized protein n=1 Tax=Bondarzewia mesenterica TaxID=1095465 RepID=A0A4S4LK46_9AGAM|nr:hypothetical protein EW146_g7675 [Bondarzewia mesenterica]